MEKTESSKKEENSDEDDITMCPILKDKLDSLTPEQMKEMRTKYDSIVKPMMKKKKEEEKEEKKTDGSKEEEKKSKVRKQHPRFEDYRKSQGACPYMNTSNCFSSLIFSRAY